jgi:glycerate kinase
VSSAVNLEKWVDWADLVITGEGKLDHQTNFGKAPERLRSLAESKGKEVVAIVGTLEEGAGNGYKAVYSLTRIAGSGREARLHADHWLEVAMKNFINDFAS